MRRLSVLRLSVMLSIILPTVGMKISLHVIFLTRSRTFHPNIPPNIACRPAAPTSSSIQNRATDFDPNTEIIALPHGWTAILQTAEMLPAGPVCAALETLYTVLIERSILCNRC